MNIFMENHQQMLAALLQENVDFIIIGGYSVIYHGYGRTTGDMDIWLKPDNENKEKLLRSLQQFGIEKESLDEIRKLDFQEVLFFYIGEQPERIDFLTRINLISYEDADKEKIIADLEGLKIPFLHLNHLILSKMNTGRTKDKADIEELQKIAALKKKE